MKSAMSRDEFIIKYWKYYLMLEHNVEETQEFVEFHRDNYATFSNRYSMLIQSIGSELDCFFKVFCDLPQKDRSNISNYAELVLSSFWPDIIDQKIDVVGKGIVLQPFVGWDKERAKQSLKWWSQFDDIKHNRSERIKEANQENMINILAALYMLEMKYLGVICDGKEPDIPEYPSQLFELIDWNYRFVPAAEGFAFVDGFYSMVDTRRIRWGD